jgi:hypothetical protein
MAWRFKLQAIARCRRLPAYFQPLYNRCKYSNLGAIAAVMGQLLFPSAAAN